jgi:hypothetical protein
MEVKNEEVESIRAATNPTPLSVKRQLQGGDGIKSAEG